ncbi:MAG: hypothetical protein AVDCRST_MAG23-16, partial [uncultured Sphingosinicella sp.]
VPKEFARNRRLTHDAERVQRHACGPGQPECRPGASCL